MANLLAALLLALGLASPALATQIRDTADSLLEAAPDQFTLHEMTTPMDEDDDAEDLTKKDAKRLENIASKTAEYKAASSPIVKSELLYDIAKLHAERVDYLRELSVKAYKKEYDRWWIGESLTKPVMKDNDVKEELLTIVNKLRDFTANFSKDPRLAEVNWMIGSSMARTGSEHFDLYLKQAAQHAKSPEWKHRSELTRADWLVSKNRPDEALPIYEEVRKDNPIDSLKAYATYRLGWIYLVKALNAEPAKKVDLLKKAEAGLQLVVKTVKKDEETRFRIRREAINDLTWLWAELDDEKSATTFYEANDLKDSLPAFKKKQAEEWLRQGKLDKAVPYYQNIITLDPEIVTRPDIHLKLAHAFIAAGDVPAMQKEIESLVKITSDEKNEWFDEHEDSRELIDRAKKMVELLPVTAGFRLIQTAQAQKDPKRKAAILTSAIGELQTQAAKEANPEKKLALRIAIFQSQLELEKFSDALAQLDSIVAMGSSAGPQLEIAALERIKILIKLIEDAKLPELPPPGEVKKPIPLPELKIKLAKAANDYLKIAPAAENAPNLRYQVAYDLFSYGHYTEALPLLEAVANDFPKSDQGKSAIEICVSMNLKFENWDELIRLSTSFLNNRSVKGKNLREFLKQNLEWAKSQKPAN